MTARFVQAGSVLTRQLDDAILVRARGAGSVHSLSGAGTEIWRLLATPMTVDELVAGLSEVFGIRSDDIGDDVRRILDDLVRARLVRRRVA